MDNEEPSKQDAQKANTSPLPLDGVEAVSSEGTAPATAQQLAKVEKEMSGFERSTLKWARTAVILSGVAAFFVCAQWWEMKRATDDATATQQAVDMPIVVLTNIEHSRLPKSEALRVHQEWSNLGGSRADHVTIQWNWSVNPPPSNPTYRFMYDLIEQTTLPAERVASRAILKDTDIPVTELDPASDKGGYLYVFGKITFNDLFPYRGQTGRHIIHYVEYSEKLSRSVPTDGDGSARPDEFYEKGNCYDSECSDYPSPTPTTQPN
jgi:hypothetical protein